MVNIRDNHKIYCRKYPKYLGKADFFAENFQWEENNGQDKRQSIFAKATMDNESKKIKACADFRRKKGKKRIVKRLKGKA